MLPGADAGRSAGLAAPARRRLASHWLALAGVACIAAVTVIAYLPSLRGGFLIDDDLLLTDSPLIRAPDGVYRFWFTADAYDYWPVTNTSLWLEWRLWEMRSTGYRVTNLALHVIASLLVWKTLRRLSIPGAFLAALLFALHPVNVESVAWIAQRKSLLAMLFLLLSTLSYLDSEAQPAVHGGRPRTDRWYWLSLVAFALAMLSKVSAAILPALLLGITWWMRPLARRDLARLTPFVLLAAALIGVNLWFRAQTMEIANSTWGPIERFLGAATAVWFYLSKALLPVNLVFMYPRWPIHADRWQWWIPLLAALGVTGVLWAYRRRWSRGVLLAWLFFCVALLPAMGFTEQLVVEDHYQHVALIAVVAVVAAGWAGARRYAGRSALNAVAGVVVATLAWLTWHYSARYSDSVAMLRPTVEAYPDSALAHHNLGFALLETGRSSEARRELEAALQIDPTYAEAHNNLGSIVARAGEPEAALRHFQAAVRLRPDYPAARNNLGSMLREIGRPEEAIEQFQIALQLKPDFPQAQRNYGRTLLQVGRLPEAIEHLQLALRSNPDDRDAREALEQAVALQQAGGM